MIISACFPSCIVPTLSDIPSAEAPLLVAIFMTFNGLIPALTRAQAHGVNLCLE